MKSENMKRLTAVGGALLGAIAVLLLSPVLPPLKSALAATSTAGATAGSFDVSDSGAATYTIPIIVPPGVRGIVPALALAYHSQNRSNGLPGIGFSLSGLSVIHRCGAVIAIDGYKGGVNYDTNDRYCLDGERLIAIGGNEYRTEHESWQRVVASDATTNPSFFIVYAPDGKTHWYGGSPDSRIEAQGQVQGTGTARLWALNRVQDKRGNYLTVAYTEDNANGDYRPHRIEYTGNAGQGAIPRAAVEFGYTTRTDIVTRYEAGALQRVVQRLSAITTSADGVTVKQYRLGYDTRAAAGMSRLTSVTECGYDSATAACLAPTTFAWQGYQGHVAATWGGGAYSGGNSDFADLNGDGRADYITGNGATRSVSLSTGTGLTVAGWNGNPAQYGDIDGDGLADGLDPYGFNTTGRPIGNWNIYNMRWATAVWRSTWNGFQTRTDWVAGDSGVSDNLVYYDHQLADLDGDGRLDMYGSGFYVGNYSTAAKSIGTGFSPLAGYAGLYANSPLFQADLNGDGRAELFYTSGASLAVWVTAGTGVTAQTWNGNPVSTYDNTRFTDLNGDGNQDLIVVSTHPYQVGLSTGKGFTLQGWSGPGIETGAGNQSRLHFADFNADGLDDVAMVSSGSYWLCLSTGTTFVCGAAASFPGWTATSAIESTDLNGDGLSDLAAVSTTGVHALQLSTGSPDLLKSVTHGQGAQTAITYKPLTDASVYTKGTDAVAYPVKHVQDATWVVAAHTQSNGIGSTNLWSYFYRGQKYHHTAARSLGFASRDVTGPDGVLSRQYFYQTPELSGQAGTAETQTGGRTVKSDVTARDFVALGGGRVLPRLLQSVSSGTDTNGASLGSTTTTYSVFDAYGFPQTVTTNSSDGRTNTTTTTYSHDTANWLLGRPVRTAVTATATGQITQTRTTSYSYVPTGELQFEILEPNSTDLSLQLVTAYGYDVYGNRHTTTVTGWDGTALTSRANITAFDATGRFLVRTTNTLGHTAYVDATDTRFGLATAMRDANGIQTTTRYDAFGRKVEEIQYANTPQLLQTSVRYETWAGTGWAPQTTSLPGLASITTLPGGGELWVYADQLGREVERWSQGLYGVWVVVNTEYDGLGRKTRQSLPTTSARRYTTYIYDALGRLTRVERPLDVQGLPCAATTIYNGLTTTVTNCKNQPVATTRNVSGLTTTTSDGGGTVTNGHDAFGNLISVRDPAGNVTSLGYDLRGRKTSMNDPDMGAWTYAYNAYGELIRQQDAKAQATTMTYDSLGRMKTRVRPEGTTTWTHDAGTMALGKPTTVASPGYSESRTYEAARGLPATLTQTIGTSSYTTTTQYDSLARPAYLTYPGGFRTENRYDGFGHLAEVWSSSLAVNIRYWKANAADATGAVTEEVYGNGLTTRFTHDSGTGRPLATTTANAAGTRLRNLTFDWDVLGNLTARSWFDGTLQRIESFGYDQDGYSLNRLTSVSGPAPKTYRYDALGNLTSKSDTGTYSYTGCGNRPHAVCAITGTLNTSFTYDANGNQLTGNGRTEAWTAFNKVSTVTRGATTSTFTYGADDQRITKNHAGGITTHYVGKLYERLTWPGNVSERHFIHAGGNLVALTIVNNGGTPYTNYYHQDHLGSVDAISNSSGVITARLSYDAWGKRRNPNGTDTAFSRTSVRGYTRHEHDDEVGLINMNAREYDPAIARFISPDPILDRGFPTQTLNRYTYVGNNPLSFTDPSGHGKGWKKFRKIFKAIVAVVLSVVTAGLATAYAFAALASSLVSVGLTGAVASFATVIGASAIGGAVGGAVGGGAMCGSDCARAGARSGAVSGAIFSGAGIVSSAADFGTTGQILTRSTASGLASDANGGKFGDGFKTTLGIETLNAGAMWMREKMIAQSSTPMSDGSVNPNATGTSSGFRHDGFKLGGCRAPCAEADIFGGIQGKSGSIFGISYKPGSFGDLLTESYAGPHDFLNSFMYDRGGNLSATFSQGVGGVFSDAVSYLNVIPATAFVAGSVAQTLVPYTYVVNQP